MRSPALPAVLVFGLLSCSSELPQSSRPPGSDGGSGPLGPMIDAEGPAEPLCPLSEPKVGDTCSTTLTASEACEFVVAECRGPMGDLYPEYVSYCCLDAVWRLCGGRSACDLPGDAGVGTDGALDGAAPDAVDGTPDVDPDAAVDAEAEQDAEIDAEPDVLEDGSGDPEDAALPED